MALREASAGGDSGEPVPAGPAQAPVSGTVTVPVSGAGVQVQPVTAASLEFDVVEGFDDAALEVHAAPALPADIDLFLQRQQEDGSWSSDLASGASGSLEEETLRYGRTDPGRYRVVVHNWAGTPTTVDVTITFYNSEGVVGGAPADAVATTIAHEAVIAVP